MKDKFILIVPLSLYKHEEEKLIIEAVMRMIKEEGVSAVYIGCQYGLWPDLKEACQKANIPFEVSSNRYDENLFLKEDVINYLIKVDRCTAKVGLVSMEYCSERLHAILTDAHRQNINFFSCSLIFKTFVVKSPFNLDKVTNYLRECFRSTCYNWSKNGI